ncbi:fasciclin domain-containing protein [uncultured Treponema sp.]|uniref:fasciclin domain-containing protein n=1 Tax=uncultured Treponema sp. TaxID=162155 RepID=UPI0025D8A7FF|nr:fasciclin domain-containing protein [uncultured Treponema sp.]
MKKTVLTLGVSALVAAAVFAQEFNPSSSALGELSTNANVEASANQESVSENADDKTLSAQEISKSIEEVDGIKVFANILKNSSDKVKDVDSDSGVTVLAPIDAIADTEKIVQNISDYIVPEKLTKENLETKSSVQTLSGKTLPVEVKDSAILINNVEVASLADSSDDKVSVLRLANNFSEEASLVLAK